MHLTAFSVCSGEAHVIIPYSAFSVIYNVPYIYVGLTAFKVKDDLRGSAEVELEVNGGFVAHIQGCSHVARDVIGSVRLADSSKAQAVERTERRVVGGEAYVIRAEADLVQAVVDGCLHGDLRRLAVGDRNDGLAQRDRVGGCDVEPAFADDLVLINQLNSGGAFGAVRGKDAV